MPPRPHSSSPHNEDVRGRLAGAAPLSGVAHRLVPSLVSAVPHLANDTSFRCDSLPPKMSATLYETISTSFQSSAPHSNRMSDASCVPIARTSPRLGLHGRGWTCSNPPSSRSFFEQQLPVEWNIPFSLRTVSCVWCSSDNRNPGPRSRHNTFLPGFFCLPNGLLKRL